MTKSSHAINIRKLRQTFGSKPFSNFIDYGCRAINCCQNTNVITRTHFAIGTNITLESSPLCFRQHNNRLIFTRVGIVTIKFLKIGVVTMHHRAWFNNGIGKSYGNVIFEDGFTLENFFGRNFVTSGNLTTTSKVFAWHGSANANIDSCYNDIIVRM